MKLVEIRDLDGPNIFLLEPAIKVEFAIESDQDSRAAAVFLSGDDFGVALMEMVDRLHERAGLEPPNTVVAPMEVDGNVSLAFGWSNRRAGRAIGRAIASLAIGESVDLDQVVAAVVDAVSHPVDGDEPDLIRDADRHIPAVGITATNGKTTTTRLMAHIATNAGKTAGWCTTSGVFIAGEEVLEGDYTGPAGARRVLLDPSVEIALLETARGGILLRGLGYESNDVSIFINVSADHLGLLGIETVHGLAMTKSVVTAVTRSSGAVVLNADDPLVWQFASSRPAPVVAVSKNPESEVIREHRASGGSALVLESGELVWFANGARQVVIAIESIPITYGGRAMHMLENAMHAAAGALALGFTIEEVRSGLETFRSDATSNPGRLNLFTTPGGTRVLVDFAHNEAGVEHLLTLATSMLAGEGVLRTVAGSAGDRTDETIRSMIQMAARASRGGVYLRETSKYLRGRASNDALVELYASALSDVGAAAIGVWPSELDATRQAVEDSGADDVVAIMAYEQSSIVRDWLVSIGATTDA